MNVHFNTASFNLADDPKAAAELRDRLNDILINPNGRLHAISSTDSEGSGPYNLNLSINRMGAFEREAINIVGDSKFRELVAAGQIVLSPMGESLALAAGPDETANQEFRYTKITYNADDQDVRRKRQEIDNPMVVMQREIKAGQQLVLVSGGGVNERVQLDITQLNNAGENRKEPFIVHIAGVQTGDVSDLGNISVNFKADANHKLTYRKVNDKNSFTGYEVYDGNERVGIVRYTTNTPENAIASMPQNFAKHGAAADKPLSETNRIAIVEANKKDLGLNISNASVGITGPDGTPYQVTFNDGRSALSIVVPPTKEIFALSQQATNQESSTSAVDIKNDILAQKARDELATATGRSTGNGSPFRP